MESNKQLWAHGSLFLAAVIWGMMAPLGKDAMGAGVPALALASLRMIGGAACFWLASAFVPWERVPLPDLLQMLGAALFGIVLNQGAYTFGLSLTSPVDASIIITVMPVITLLLAALFLKEPITWKKGSGVLLGVAGALLLIFSNRPGGLTGVSAVRPSGSVTGNLLCLTASLCFATYLTLFRNLIRRYRVITLMRWMFTFAALCFLPFAAGSLRQLAETPLSWTAWAETGYVVFCGTFLAYILMIYGQQHLRPTVVSMYNYVQPVISTLFSVAMGLALFGWVKAGAALLIFGGVWLVTRSKSREDLDRERYSTRR